MTTDNIDQQDQYTDNFAKQWSQLSEQGKKIILNQIYINYKKDNLDSNTDNNTKEFEKFMGGVVGRIEQIFAVTLQESTQDPNFSTNPNINQALSLLSESLINFGSVKYQFTYSADIAAMIKEVANHVWAKRVQLISQQIRNDNAKMQDELMASDKLIYEKLVKRFELANKQRHEREYKQEVTLESMLEKENELAIKMIQEYEAKNVLNKILSVDVSPNKREEIAGNVFKKVLAEIKRNPIQNFAQSIHLVRELEQLKHSNVEHPGKNSLLIAGDDFTEKFKYMIKHDNDMHLAFDLFQKVGFLTKPNAMTGEFLKKFNHGLTELEANGSYKAVAMVREIISHVPGMEDLLCRYSLKPKDELSEKNRKQEVEQDASMHILNDFPNDPKFNS